uniref:AAA+ ATPase domain-containing protein n=1 Tax=Heliothis virescens TaxID=7102 RepID=A0A2A4IUN2_HELVI
MTTKKYTFFLLTGEPGVGKTTLTKKLSTDISSKGIQTTGFYTEEVRKGRSREGFDVVTLDGTRGRLARDQSLLTEPIKHKVGKYGVLIQEFEKVALPLLVKPDNSQQHLLVIDEIGKMEFFSEPFKTAIRTIFSPSSNCVVLATI